IGRDRLLDQHMDTLPDAAQGDLVVQMGGRRDGDRVDPASDERVEIIERAAAKGACDKLRLGMIGVDEADEVDSRKLHEDARMVAAHNAYAHHPYAQQPLRAVLRGLSHDPPGPPCRDPLTTSPS